MKILLTTLNSKYVHSNLALKYLYTVVAGEYSDVQVREFTINQDPSYIYTELVRANCDMVCFSCYIWNIEKTRELASALKKARPSLKICLGGPEITAAGPDFAVSNPWADYLLCGEGEYAFYRLCQVLTESEAHHCDPPPEELLQSVPGLIYRGFDGKTYVNEQMEPMDFNHIPFPYSILDCAADQVVYYESVRGCPFRCSYCLSSIEKTLRPLHLDRVKAELGYFLHKNVMQVKFIDRTFNYNKDRAMEIWRYLIDNDNGVTNFHFEICGDLLDKAALDLLKHARKGLFQFEIGIQSCNPETLLAVNRKENVYPILYNVEQLMTMGNIHVHVDLIAGLPYETYELFARSFNKVYALQADMLQLGFLKVLGGTPIWHQREQFGILHRELAPYEVIRTEHITAEELTHLHMIEHMLDIYYNRGGFSRSTAYLIAAVGKGAFGFYERLADFYYDADYQHRNRKKEDQYRILHRFAYTLGDDTGRETEILLGEDLAEHFNEEEQKRFFKKGWEVIQ